MIDGRIELNPRKGALVTLGAVCTVENCVKTPVGRGLCRAHYDRWRRTGSPWRSSDVPLPACLHPGCGRAVDHHNARYCNRHAQRAAQLNRVSAPPPTPAESGALPPPRPLDER